MTGRSWLHPGHRVGQQVVVLGRLQRHRDPGQRAELPGPHPGRVDHHLGLDPAGLGQHRGDPPAAGLDAGRGHPLDDPHAQLPGALGQRRGHAHRVGPALVGDVERGQHVVGAGQRPHPGQLRGRDLRVLDAEPVHPGAFAAQRLAAVAGWWPARCARPARNPVECPVSCSSRAYRSREYRLKNRAVSSVIPAEVISPAACQVVPAVSWCCSSSTTSVQPRCARW